MVLPEEQKAVLIVGGRGEFGQFLQQDILPRLCWKSLLTIEHETPREEQDALLQQAQHLVLATPLAGYAELACELVYRCSGLQSAMTFWLIPSVQAGIWRSVTATLEIVGNPYLSAVFAHPMYGPNGFRATEPEARTFQNILTALYEGRNNPLVDKVGQLRDDFQRIFNIGTTDAFNPEEHDRITAYSQGLSYGVARLMFERPELDALIREQMPDLHHSFHANHNLIIDFLKLNAYMPQVLAAFADSWRQTSQATYADLLHAFARADMALNRVDSPIPTRWYAQLRSAAGLC
ncbi:MAG TPA: hypothetical protein VF544_03485 [Pyrinomonadaceae bacterium]|jgi:hypothetical protein